VMHDHGQSDRPVVPAKSPNKTGRPGAEGMEGSGLAKGNPSQQNAPRTLSREGAPSALERVRQAAERDKQMRFTALLHHIYNVEHQAPRRAIERLAQNGMLVEPELPHLIKYRYKISELQAMLKQRGLPISGRKDELIKRLVRADAEGMKRATDGLRLLICSAPGREIAEQYIAAEKAERTELEDSVLGLIGQRLFEAASVLVAAYEASRPLPRGLGIDWRNHDTARDVAILQAIWTSTPKILSRLDNDRVTALRVVASNGLPAGRNVSPEAAAIRASRLSNGYCHSVPNVYVPCYTQAEHRKLST
jgi:hypothetical protein